MPGKLDIKRLLVVSVAALLVLWALLELGVIERFSYSIEKGRLRALRETLPVADRTEESSLANRVLAQLVMPAVVSIETDYAAQTADAPESVTETAPSAEDTVPDDTPPARESEHREGDVDDSDSSSVRQGIGSGFVIDSGKGHILTNAHVVDGAARLRVYLADGRQADGTVLGSDQDSDLAVVRVDLPGLHQLPLGDSETAAVGDEVLAVGNPFGLEGTVTKGIISAVNRRNVTVDDGESPLALLQTDATISPGSSGGPLVNMRGEVIGITSAFITGTGLADGVGFAIPSARAAGMVDDLIEGGPTFLGVLVWSASDPNWQEEVEALGWRGGYGAVVDEVFPGTGAARAGLKKNDVILEVEHARVGDIEKLGGRLQDFEPDAQVSVQLWRGDKIITVPVRLGRRYAPR